MRTKLKPMDLFAAVNIALLAILCVAYDLQRLRPHAVSIHLGEFAVYAAAIAIAATLAWRVLRRVALPVSVLVVLQVGILAHVAGGVIPIHGGRLYDVVVLGLTFDKWVHAFNALAGAAFVDHLLRGDKGPLPRGLVVLMVVLGAGAVVEMIEYLTQLILPFTGVGGYDNNMRDLFANLAGGLAYLAARAVALRGRPALAVRGEPVP
jgi:hypothetical protein